MGALRPGSDAERVAELEYLLRGANEHCKALWRHRRDGQRLAFVLGLVAGMIAGVML